MKRVQSLVTLLILLCLTSTVGMAQLASGSMSGTVTDPNGAIIPGAKVVAVHEPTGREYPTVTTDAGVYVFPNLPTGPYTVSVEHPGFKKLVRTGIEIRIGQRQDLNLQVEVGDVQQKVEVKGEAPLLETTTAERGQVLSQQMLYNLPIYTGGLRNAESFVGYMPGVNSGAELSINGSNGRAKEIEIDGASLTLPESGGVNFYFPGFEAYSEMKLVTSTYGAEYGRLGGGLEAYTSKSGTNDVHGAAFLNMRRDIWEAAGWSSNQVFGRTPGFRQKVRFNEEGGAAGGPVYIPKVYNGRNRTFFYFTIAKDVRPASPIVTNGETLPTSLMKTGNFSQLTVPIFDPATTSSAGGVSSRLPFAGNLIPTSRFSTISKNILPFIPDPTRPGITNNFDFLGSSVHDDTIWTLKFDHSITQNHRIAYFMTHRNYLDDAIQYFPGPISYGLTNIQRPDDYRVNHDWTISPNKLLHTTFGFSRSQQLWNNPLQNGYGSKIGLPLSGLADAFPTVGFETDFPSPGLPAVGPVPGGNTVFGMSQGKVNNGGQWNWTTHINQQFSWIHGKHEMKMGWDIRRLRTIGNDWAGSNGFYYFSRAQTADPTKLTSTGHSFASFLLGAVDQATATATPVTALQIRYGYHAGFFTDNFRITPRFTLNYGLRYEIPVGWHELNGNYSSFDPTVPNPGANNLPGALVFAGVGPNRTGKKRLYPMDFTDVGPRAGFAYQAAKSTTIRGGFGIYYQTLGNGGCGCTDGVNGSFSQNSDGVNQAFNWDQGGVRPPPGYQNPPRIDPSFDNFVNGVYRMGPNFGKAPRIYNWSFTLQQEVGKFLLEAGYVGNRGHGLASSVFLNQLPISYLALGSLLSKNINDPAVVAAGYKEPFPGFAKGWGGGATLAQALRPFPQYGNIYDGNAGVGKTWYDALQTKVERRFGDFQLIGSWVWSKSLSLMTFRQIFTQTQVNTQDAYNIPDGKSYQPWDYPHVVNILSTYQLPFGKGKKYLGSVNRYVNLAVGGWILSAAQQYRSGGLIQISTPGNPLGGGSLFSAVTKANATGNPIRTGVSSGDLDPNNPNVRWINSGANAPYVVAPAYTLGTSAFYDSRFRNPWYRNENISIQKNFNFTESIRLQYRADAINAFNRTDFGGVNGIIGTLSANGVYSNPNFGRVSGPQAGPRIISMGLRLEF
jgi:hypothetical protein